MERGEVWWAELPDPVASEPGFRRPVVIVSRTRSTGVGSAPCWPWFSRRISVFPMPLGNVFLAAAVSGLPKDSVANVSQIVTLDKGFLSGRLWPRPALGDEGDR